MKFAGVCLETNDVRGLVDFYTRVLLVKAEGDSTHTVLDEASLAIYNPGNLPVPEDQPADRRVVLMFKVDDVDQEYERLKAMQVKFTTLPKTEPWGLQAMSFVDPEGNPIDFFSNPKS